MKKKYLKFKTTWHSFLLGGLSLWGSTGSGAQEVTNINTSNLDALLSKSRGILAVGRGAVTSSMSSLLSISPETMVWLSSMLCLIVLLAFATNPSDSSFRSYLTDNVLRRQMQAFRQEVFDAAQEIADGSDSLQGITHAEFSRTVLPSHQFSNRITMAVHLTE